MTITQRVGAVAKGLISLMLEIMAIGTETAKLAAIHLDAFVDELNEKMTGIKSE